jgi:predicted nucleotidyltransferase component of viral defense system
LPEIPSLDLHEIIGEKVRAAAQRNRVRDLFDLYQFSDRQFDRPTVRKIAVIKCWETNFAFDPENFLASLRDGNFDWLDLRRLVRSGWNIQSEEVIDKVQTGFGFLSALTSEEAVLAGDPYSRQYKAYRFLTDELRSSFNK